MEEENVTEYEPTSQLIKTCHDQYNKDRRQCNNFSIESILSSASSALALVAKQKATRLEKTEETFSVNHGILEQGILRADQTFPGNRSPEDSGIHENVLEQEMGHAQEDNDDEEDDVDVDSRNSSPSSQLSSNHHFNINTTTPNFQLFGLSKGNNCQNTLKNILDTLIL